MANLQVYAHIRRPADLLADGGMDGNKTIHTVTASLKICLCAS